MPRACLPLLAAFTLTPLAAAQTNVATALHARLAEITVDEVAFDSVVDWLAEQSGLTIHVNWERLAEYGIARDKPVSLKARNLPLSQVLWLLMNQLAGSDVKLAYRGSGTLLILSTEEDLGREMLTRVYDVRDLLDRAPRFTNAARINPSEALQQGGNSGSASSIADPGNEPEPEGAGEEPGGEELVRLIRDTIDPDSWIDNGGRGRIVFWRGQIVVFNNIFVHQRLAGPIPDGD